VDEFTVRLAGAEDSEPFAKWIAESTQIPVEDVKASLKDNNPTSITLVIEKNGEVVLFAPLYAVARLAFIGFNPEMPGRERLKAMDALKKAAQAFWGMHGVNEIETLTMEGYPVAQWAMKHGFAVEPRQVLKLTTKEKETVN
jgi:hypothetical protein